MYALSDTDRGRPFGMGQKRRELPVLFHLMDVSRPPPAAEEAKPLFRLAPPTEPAVSPIFEPPPSGTPLVATSSHVAEPTPLAAPSPIAARVLSASVAELPALPTLASIVPAVSPETVADAAGAHAPATIANQTTSEAAAAEPPTELAPTTSEPTNANLADLVTPASSITSRSQVNGRRKPRTPASEDWFAAHGKFIAVAFVLALIGTIYFARNSRTPKGPAAATYGPSPFAGNAGQSREAAPAVSTEVKPTHVVETVAATADSKADLFPPSAPQLVSQPASGDKAENKDKLFEFPAPKPTDDRVASRPATATNSGSPSPAAPAASTPPASPSTAPALSTTYSNSSSFVPANPAPAPPPAYPVTSAPPLVGPGAPAAPAPPPQMVPGPPPLPGYAPTNSAYPGTPPSNPPINYRSQYQMPGGSYPPPQQAWSSAPPAAAWQGQYPPQDSTARGPRYERTGSSNY